MQESSTRGCTSPQRRPIAFLSDSSPATRSREREAPICPKITPSYCACWLARQIAASAAWHGPIFFVSLKWIVSRNQPMRERRRVNEATVGRLSGETGRAPCGVAAYVHESRVKVRSFDPQRCARSNRNLSSTLWLPSVSNGERYGQQ